MTYTLEKLFHAVRVVNEDGIIESRIADIEENPDFFSDEHLEILYAARDVFNAVDHIEHSLKPKTQTMADLAPRFGHNE